MTEFEFKTKYSESERTKEAIRIVTKYPNRVPVIVEKAKGADVPDIDKHKYLVPSDLSFGQFLYIIRKRLNNLNPEKALFLFVNNRIMSPNDTVGKIHEIYKDTDSFLYVMYSSESTFGN